jgi:YebC/PmpR family DNA-binding regulatory protein
MYEGYAAGGVALLIECLTDNRNRAAADVRTIMSRNGGTMGDPGSVAYNFSRKGVISVMKTDELSEDDVLAAVLDAGAEEVNDRGQGFEIITEPHDMLATRTALQEAGIDYDSADVEFVPGLTIAVDLETAQKIFRSSTRSKTTTTCRTSTATSRFPPTCRPRWTKSRGVRPSSGH